MASTADTETSSSQPARGMRRRLRGRVVSDTDNENRARKTVTVQVERRYKHRAYGKYLKSRKRYHAHDAEETCRTGDIVEIQESRPLSKTKRWIVLRVIERAEIV